MRYTFFDICDLICLTIDSESSEVRYTINAEILFWVSQLSLDIDQQHQFGFLIPGKPEDQNIVFKLTPPHFCEFDKEEILAFLEKQVPLFFTSNPVVLNYVKIGRFEALRISFNNINALFFSSDAEKREWLKGVGVDSQPLYDEATIDPSDLAALKIPRLIPPSRVIVYLDIDYTLLDLFSSRLLKRTVLNETVLNFMKDFRRQYPGVVWRIITARPAEKKSVNPISVNSIRDALEKSGFDISEVICMGKQRSNGKISRGGHKIWKIREGIQKGDLILFLDDKRAEVVEAYEVVNAIKDMGACLYPIRVHRKGNFSASDADLLRSYITTSLRSEDELENEEKSDGEEAGDELQNLGSAQASDARKLGIFSPPKSKRRCRNTDSRAKVSYQLGMTLGGAS